MKNNPVNRTDPSGLLDDDWQSAAFEAFWAWRAATPIQDSCWSPEDQDFLAGSIPLELRTYWGSLQRRWWDQLIGELWQDVIHLNTILEKGHADPGLLYQWQQEKEYLLRRIQILETAIQQDLAAEKRCVSRYFPVPSPKASAAQQQRPPKHFRREKITNTIWVIEEGNDGFVLVYLTRKPSTIECATNLIYGVGQFETDDKPSIVIKYDARSPEDREIAIHEAKRQQISGALHEFNESALTGIASAPENALRHQFPTFDAVASAVEAVEEVRNIPQSTQDSGSCSQYGWQATLVVLVVVAGVIQGKNGGAPNSGAAANAADVASTAAKGFKSLKSKECANAVPKALKQKGKCGEISDLKAKGNRPYIYSDRLGKTISENGDHRAVRIGNTVYDNLNPNGIPYNEWLSDLHSVYGFDISITPF